MLIVQICVGSSCHLRGAPEIVELLQKEVEKNHLEDDVILTGSFCSGHCNCTGGTVTINDEVHTGINRENFREFWNEKILAPVMAERG